MGSANQPPSSESETASGKRRYRLLAVLLAAIILVASLPWLISNTSLRDGLLEQVVGNPEIQASSGGASLGWFSPLTINDLTLRSVDGAVDIKIPQLRAEKSWLQLWWSTPDLGGIQLTRPRIELVVDEQDLSGERGLDTAMTSFDAWPVVSVAIEQGALRVLNPGIEEPVIDVDGADIGFHIERQPPGISVLIIDPIELARRETLTAELCDDGLQFIVPELSDELTLEGAYSLELTKVRLPLGGEALQAKQEVTEIAGVLTLHDVTAGLKNEVTRNLIMLAAEMMGLGEIPERIRLTDDARLDFRFQQGRLHHDGLAIVLPDELPGFSFQTSGSVGLDESIDLAISMQIPLSALDDNPLARQLSEAPVELRVTGTANNPQIGLPADQDWVTRLTDRLLASDLTDSEQQLAENILEVLRDLIDETKGIPVELPAPLLERVRGAS